MFIFTIIVDHIEYLNFLFLSLFYFYEFTLLLNFLLLLLLQFFIIFYDDSNIAFYFLCY